MWNPKRDMPFPCCKAQKTTKHESKILAKISYLILTIIVSGVFFPTISSQTNSYTYNFHFEIHIHFLKWPTNFFQVKESVIFQISYSDGFFFSFFCLSSGDLARLRWQVNGSISTTGECWFRVSMPFSEKDFPICDTKVGFLEEQTLGDTGLNFFDSSFS